MGYGPTVRPVKFVVMSPWSHILCLKMSLLGGDDIVWGSTVIGNVNNEDPFRSGAAQNREKSGSVGKHSTQVKFTIW